MKKKALLMAPLFMKYDKVICEELHRRGYDVCYINNEVCVYFIRKKYKERNISIKVWQKIFPQLKAQYKEKILEGVWQHDIRETKVLSEKFDLVICVNGHYVPNIYYQFLKQKHPGAKFILYVWDDVKNIFKDKHFNYFEKKYSYNIEDCRKYNCKYLPMFIQTEVFNESEHRKYDICVIATAEKKRVAYIQKIFEENKHKFKFYIYMYDRDNEYNFFSYNEPMPYVDYLNVLSASKCVLDIERNNQEGPTTRFYDTLITKTKIITTNKHIMKYPVYSENIWILNKKKPKIPGQFINKEYKDPGIWPYNIETWMNELLK